MFLLHCNHVSLKTNHMDPMQPLSKALDQVLLDWSGLHQERESTVFCFNLRPKLWTALVSNKKMAPPPPPPFMSCFLVRSGTNSGTRRRIDIFQKRKVFRIEFPEILAWFQTPQTVSRPSRPDFQPRKTNSGTKRPIEIFKKRKMIRIEFPEFLAWFQTPQTVSRPSRPCPDRPDL